MWSRMQNVEESWKKKSNFNDGFFHQTQPVAGQEKIIQKVGLFQNKKTTMREYLTEDKTVRGQLKLITDGETREVELNKGLSK